MPEKLNLSNLQPAQARKDRKRVGRGLGSGKGRYSTRGLKGQKARAGSHKMRAGFEGGQMPIYMRVGKQRGQYSKDALPVGPFRSHTVAVNVRDLERFDAGTEITPESLAAAGLIRNTKYDLKILGHGELSKSLAVSAHNFSKSAREKIEKAGGSITWLRGEPEPRKPKRRPRAEIPEAEPEPPETEEEAAEDPESDVPVDEESDESGEAEQETEN
ncbi:MAG TPA: 50S ribosomal protein L15 [Gaiellaceae bacterium]|nr:50S ribosomal protein L15 [Gaiellaceae bacterium]